jgi:hypothetical protein
MKLIDSNRYYLKGTDNRFLHLGTAHEGAREFIAFRDVLLNKTYIEEVTTGSPVFISDEVLAQELANFFTYHKCLLIDKPDIPDKLWNNLGKR